MAPGLTARPAVFLANSAIGSGCYVTGHVREVRFRQLRHPAGNAFIPGATRIQNERAAMRRPCHRPISRNCRMRGRRAEFTKRGHRFGLGSTLFSPPGTRRAAPVSGA
jgi:hypothetical protein